MTKKVEIILVEFSSGAGEPLDLRSTNENLPESGRRVIAVEEPADKK